MCEFFTLHTLLLRGVWLLDFVACVLFVVLCVFCICLVSFLLLLLLFYVGVGIAESCLMNEITLFTLNLL